MKHQKSRQQTRLKHPKISIVIPVYNEESRLPGSIAKLRDYLAITPFVYEVLIVVEKSEDATLSVAKKAVLDDKRFLVLANHVHRGKGFAVKTGMLAARGEYIFFMDADLSTDLSAIKAFVAHLDKNQDVAIAIASREHPQSKIELYQSFARQSMGKVFNSLTRLLFPLSFRDTQCGFKAFRKEVIIPLFEHQFTNGFCFDVEILMRAKNSNYTVDELPVTWVNSNESKVNLLTGPLSMLVELVRLRMALR